MNHEAGPVDVLECDRGLESPRARQLWLEIVCDGKVSPIKPKGKVAKPKCMSARGRRQRHVEKTEQRLKSKCINSAMQKCIGCEKRRCNAGQVRIRVRQKCAERFMYVDQVAPPQSAINVYQN